MKHKKIIITGGTGYIGQELARYFGKENHVVLLSVHSVNGHNNEYGKKMIKATDGYNVNYWRWDEQHVEKHWAREIEGADIIINLAEKSVTDAIHTIGDAIRQSVVPPKLWINTTGYTEDDIRYPALEKALEAERTPFTRRIALRSGPGNNLARSIEWCYEHTDMEGSYSGSSFAF